MKRRKQKQCYTYPNANDGFLNSNKKCNYIVIVYFKAGKHMKISLVSKTVADNEIPSSEFTNVFY